MKQLAYFSNLQGVENMENTPLCDIVRNCNIDTYAYSKHTRIRTQYAYYTIFLRSGALPTEHRYYKHEKQHKQPF